MVWLGPNGAGKTTIISMLCTILKPTSGTAKVNVFDIFKEATQVRKSIGIVFQDPSVDGRLTGRENLYMHVNLYGVPAGEQKSRIDAVLKRAPIWDKEFELIKEIVVAPVSRFSFFLGKMAGDSTDALIQVLSYFSWVSL